MITHNFLRNQSQVNQKRFFINQNQTFQLSYEATNVSSLLYRRSLFSFSNRTNEIRANISNFFINENNSALNQKISIDNQQQFGRNKSAMKSPQNILVDHNFSKLRYGIILRTVKIDKIQWNSEKFEHI